MKILIPLCALVLVFGSCTTAYKAGQTPDDVYYSPARPQDEYVRAENRQPERYNYDEQADEDRYLRMRVRNRRTWQDLDYYYSDPYAFNYYNRYNVFNDLYYNTPWNNYSTWNYYYNPYNNYYNPYAYNPYGNKLVIVNPRPQVQSRPRMYNLNVYNNPQSNNNQNSSKSYAPRGRYNNSRNTDYNSGNESRNSGGRLREVFNNSSSSNSTYRDNTPAPSRSERSSNSNSGSSNSRSSNAPVRKF